MTSQGEVADMHYRLLAAIVALALARGTGAIETVPLKSGATLRGEIIEVRADTIVMALESLPDSRLTIPISQVTDSGWYDLQRRRIDPRSWTAHERLGDWAAERGLVEAAATEYRQASELAGAEARYGLVEKRAKAEARCRQEKLAEGNRLVSKDRFEEAVIFFRDLVENHPSCPAVDAARDRLADLEAFLAERRADTKAAVAAPEPGVLDKAVSAARAKQDEGDRRRKDGFLHSGDLARAEDDFVAAIRAYRDAVATVERAAGLPGAENREKEFLEIRVSLGRRLLGVYLDIGHNYIVKGNLVRASEYVGLALAIDPEDPHALGLRRAISAAAENRWGRSR